MSSPASGLFETPTLTGVGPSSRVGIPEAAGAIAGRIGLTGYLTLLVAAPILAVVVRALVDGPRAFLAAITNAVAIDALSLSIVTGLVASVINAAVGTAIAWWLVRWDVPGRRIVAALVDLPLAIPTLVVGVLLVALYGPQTPVGVALGAVGIEIAFARAGIVMALLFVTLPFVVRAVEPVLRELDPAEEEAAFTLGASRATTFRRVILPPLLPAIAAGTVQTFARCIAEFGSIAAVSGNIPHRTLAAPVHILGEVEAGAPGAASAVSVVLLAIALGLQPVAHRLARSREARSG